MWRPIIERIATMEEIERFWTIDDLERCNAILDMRDDMRDAEMEENKP